MKVFHLITGAETGGSRAHLVSLLSQLPKEEVTLAVFEEGPLTKEARAAGISVRVYPQTSRYDTSVLRRVRSDLVKEGVDILHSHGPRANVLAQKVVKGTSVVWVTTLHSDPALDFMGGGIKGKVFSVLHQRALQKMDYYFAVSDSFRQILLRLGVADDKIKTVFNGIHYTEKLAEPIERDTLQLQKEDFVVAMVARLHPVKGHDVVMEAMEQLRDVPIHILWIGDGPAKEALEEKLSIKNLTNKIHMLGHRNDVPSLYAMSHVALLASLSESFPLALLEAANERRPIIATNVGGVRDLIQSNETGWVVPVGDASALARALRDAYEKRDKLPEMGEALYTHASSQFSLDRLVEETVTSYHQLITNRDA